MKTCIKCGSHAFNLYAEGINQGGFCDVHYWQGRAHRAEAQPEQEQKCWCTTCRPITMSDMRFVVCPDCGNKRCPKANDHRNACTGSNEVGQNGSSWEHVKPLAQPEQEPCGGCGGSGWVPRDPDIGTDQECFDCNGSGAQPEQEPVAWEQFYPDIGKPQLRQEPSITKEARGTLILHSGWDDLPNGTKFYTTPPKRPWEGLTDEPTYTEQQIANACWAAEISDSKCESLLIALQEAAHNIGVKP